jgi:hypothetical protein
VHIRQGIKGETMSNKSDGQDEIERLKKKVQKCIAQDRASFNHLQKSIEAKRELRKEEIITQVVKQHYGYNKQSMIKRLKRLFS